MKEIVEVIAKALVDRPEAVEVSEEEQERSAGKTVIVSTHIIDSVDMLWDRVLIMKEGVLRADMTKDELDQTGKTLEQLFFEITEGGGE